MALSKSLHNSEALAVRKLIEFKKFCSDITLDIRLDAREDSLELKVCHARRIMFLHITSPKYLPYY